VRPPGSLDDWIGIGPEPLPVAEALAWCTLPGCGGQVAFVGTVRDHSEGRPGVRALEYEAYEEMVGPRLGEVAAEARRRWPGLGRIAMLHRTGRLGVGEASVLVVVSAPHRDEAFAAARYCIDELKAEAPIWKREHWAGGSEWVACAPHPAGTRR
jgi:molybdopterin synthase catalytic subunit